jgi:hypothetical protein
MRKKSIVETVIPRTFYEEELDDEAMLQKGIKGSSYLKDKLPK